MPRYIDLFDQRKPLGQFDLPEELIGNAGHAFRLKNAVGGGGNGVVFRAVPRGKLADEIDYCAVKLLRQQEASRRDRFANEARIMKLLDHARIAQFFDHGSVALSAFVTVPWLQWS
jgi:serine/threonine protein kinase